MLLRPRPDDECCEHRTANPRPQLQQREVPSAAATYRYPAARTPGSPDLASIMMSSAVIRLDCEGQRGKREGGPRPGSGRKVTAAAWG